MSETKQENNKKYQEYIDMLQQVHNLVLTGAPGTGKTFMAQAIAEEMGAVTRFVQFHPSYDYTDFVEGLRPIEKSDGQMGFERKDGAFKDFCREAIKNLIDSEKSIESLTKEMSWQEKLDRFVEDAIEEGTKFKTVNGSEFVISEMKSHSIVIHNEQNEKTTQVAVNADEILELEFEWIGHGEYCVMVGRSIYEGCEHDENENPNDDDFYEIGQESVDRAGFEMMHEKISGYLHHYISHNKIVVSK